MQNYFVKKTVIDGQQTKDYMTIDGKWSHRIGDAHSFPQEQHSTLLADHTETAYTSYEIRIYSKN